MIPRIAYALPHGITYTESLKDPALRLCLRAYLQPGSDSDRGARVSGQVVAGWYLDPSNSQLERYWDGSTWTPETRPSSILLRNVPEPFGYGPGASAPAASRSTVPSENQEDGDLAELLELVNELVALQYRANSRLENINTFMWIFFLLFAVPTIVALIWLVVIGNEMI